MNRRLVPVVLACGVIFQKDQTAPSHQDVLRHERERGEITNRDRRERLPARDDTQKGTWPVVKSLPDFTDFQFDTIRKNPCYDV